MFSKEEKNSNLFSGMHWIGVHVILISCLFSTIKSLSFNVIVGGGNHENYDADCKIIEEYLIKTNSLFFRTVSTIMKNILANDVKITPNFQITS